MESYTRNFKIPLYLFVIEAIVTLEKFTSLASFSVEGGGKVVGARRVSVQSGIPRSL